MLYDRHQGHFSLGCTTNKCVADQLQVIFQDADTLELMERNISFYLETLIWNTAIFKVQSPGQDQVILKTQWFDTMKCVFTKMFYSNQ